MRGIEPLQYDLESNCLPLTYIPIGGVNEETRTLNSSFTDCYDTFSPHSPQMMVDTVGFAPTYSRLQVERVNYFQPLCPHTLIGGAVRDRTSIVYQPSRYVTINTTAPRIRETTTYALPNIGLSVHRVVVLNT